MFNKRYFNSILGCIVLLLPITIFFSSCFEENVVDDAPLDVRFSQDTVRFDTVFTTMGSATRSFKVINNNSENVTIGSIRLEEGDNSMFRLNVDGTPGAAVNDVLLLGNDSIHVFVEVTVDPDAPLSISPFVIQERVIISSGNVDDEVRLEAWGQNANYFPSRDAKGQLIGLSCDGGNLLWDDPKPYVVFGLLFIDSCSLIIPAGTQVYMTGGLGLLEGNVFDDGGLFFLENGNLITQGSIEDPVVFQGARLESGFQDVAGQWAGIRFLSASQDNRIENTIIKNSIVGIRSDSAASVDLSGVQIFNTNGIGLIGVHSNINANNVLIHSNGPQSVGLVYGGNYSFRHCTFANYQNQFPALFMDNFTCLDEDCDMVAINPIQASFQNCIIMGSNDDEIEIADITEGADPDALRLTFDHTLIRVLETKALYPATSCQNCLEYDDEPVFLDQIADDYRLDTMSLARDQGVFIRGLDLDIVGKARDRESPDLGCYEF